MKKLLAMPLIVCFFSILLTPAFANNKTETIVLYEDGSYTVVSIQKGASSTVKEMESLRSTKTRTKTAKHYNSNDELEWTASITATFTYNGATASCTSVSKATTIYDNSWRCTASSCSKSGATATGNFTFKHYVLQIPNQTINQLITMTCDKNGNIT